MSRRWLLLAVLLLLCAAVVYAMSSWGGWVSDLWTLAVAASWFAAGRASRDHR